MMEIQIDNSALSDFRDCHRKHKHRNKDKLVLKDRGEALAFGTTLHLGRRVYRHLRMHGKSHKEALATALRVIDAVWEREMPAYMHQPHKADDRRGKHNAQALFTGYMTKYETHIYDPVLVESPFQCHIGDIRVGRQTCHVILTGAIDELSTHDSRLYVTDFKTSSYALSASYFSSFRISSALMGYIWISRKLTGKAVHGAVIDAVQVTRVDKTALKARSDLYKVAPIVFTDEQLEEWRENALVTVADIVRSERDGFWRMSQGAACNLYGSCAYKRLCEATPGARAAVTRVYYKQEERFDPAKQETIADLIALANMNSLQHGGLLI